MIKILNDSQLPDKIGNTAKAFIILNPVFVKIMEFKKLKKKDWPKDGVYPYRVQAGGKWTTEKIHQFLCIIAENEEDAQKLVEKEE